MVASRTRYSADRTRSSASTAATICRAPRSWHASSSRWASSSGNGLHRPCRSNSVRLIRRTSSSGTSVRISTPSRPAAPGYGRFRRRGPEPLGIREVVQPVGVADRGLEPGPVERQPVRHVRREVAPVDVVRGQLLDQLVHQLALDAELLLVLAGRRADPWPDETGQRRLGEHGQPNFCLRVYGSRARTSPCRSTTTSPHRPVRRPPTTSAARTVCGRTASPRALPVAGIAPHG